MTNPEIINDISLLYELALTVGKSLDVRQNAENFVSTLMRRKGLTYASLWLKKELIDGKSSSQSYQAIYSHPNFRDTLEKIPSSHPIVGLLDKQPIFYIHSSEKRYKDFVWEKEVEQGSLAIFALGEIGFLKLYAFQNHQAIQYPQLYKLKNVIDRFAQSLEAGMVYKKLIQEIQDRKKAQQELLKSKEVEEQFFANMSHEIRTPLNGMLGMMNLMLSTELSSEQKEYIQDMMLSGKTLLAILNDILDYTKIHQGKIVLEEVSFDLYAKVKSLYKAADARANKEKVKVLLDIGDQVPQYVMGDPVRFDQVLNNLIGNALKFTEKGSIHINLALKKIEEEKIHLHVAVSDTGIGITKENQERIFSNFVQADRDTTRKYGGTGLGLAIVRQLVSLMGGEIQLSSELGKGSTFAFSILFKKSDKVFQAKSSNLSQKALKDSLKGYRILLAEDMLMNQKVATRMLKKWGADVELAENGQEAFELCREEYFDLILMDLQMPVMSGLEATQKIRQELLPPISKVPIIALTAAVRDTVKKQVLESGMDTYVMKPFEPDALHTIIKYYLQKRQRKLKEKYQGQATNGIQLAINTSYLEEIANGDQQFIKDMLNLFVDQAPLELESLFRLIKEHDWPSITQHVHKLKYPYASLGRMDLKNRLAEMEDNSKNEQVMDVLLQDYNYIKSETSRILAEISAYQA